MRRALRFSSTVRPQPQWQQHQSAKQVAQGHPRRSASGGATPEQITELPAAWAKTYAATTPDELRQAYRSWAPTYCEDSISIFGYRAPSRAAQILSSYLDADYRLFGDSPAILDVGAGTGLVGERLHAMGHRNITACDISPDMLDVAMKKSCYEKVLCFDLEDSDQADRWLPDSMFDAAICVGLFTPNHVGVGTLDELVRCVRPGGLIVMSLRDDFQRDESNGFQRELDRQTKTGLVELLGASESELYTPNVSDDITFRVWTYRVCASGIRGESMGC